MHLAADESFESRKLLGFFHGGGKSSERRPRNSTYRLGRRAVCGRRKQREITSREESIFTLNVDGEALEEDTEWEFEDETEQDAERVRTISDPGRTSKKEREELEATHCIVR